MKTLRTIIQLSLIIMLMNGVGGCYYDQVVPEVVPPVTTEVSFSKDIVPIFNASCNLSGCHSGSVSPNLLPDFAYNALIGDQLVDVSDPANSELYLWITGQESTPMPPSGINAEYNAAILAWIEQGALNN